MDKLTAKITLKEYRELIEANAIAEFQIESLESELERFALEIWEKEQEIDELKKKLAECGDIQDQQ